MRAHSDLEGVVTEGAVQIGPFARLRPGTVLADGVHIGNFVETKKVTMGVGSKANHLTYLGDAVIGSKVNIGAGTITCNYDGVNKSQTTIGDGAFVGSNSALVAPIEIGANSTIGAGSVITSDAPAGQLSDACAADRDRRLEAADQEIGCGARWIAGNSAAWALIAPGGPMHGKRATAPPFSERRIKAARGARRPGRWRSAERAGAPRARSAVHRARGAAMTCAGRVR